MASTREKLRNLWRMTTGPVRERGFLETIRSIRICAQAIALEQLEAFDRTHGTDTERSPITSDLDASGDDVQALWRYFPTLRSTFTSIMASLPFRLEGRIFVDLGSGKGRALLLASEYPFERIVGVELSPALHRVAEKNVHAWQSAAQRCRAFELVCMDARDYPFPPEDALVYLFQPFPADVLSAVLDNLGQSVAQCPRDVHIVYHNPIFHVLFARQPFLELEHWEHAKKRNGFDWALYRVRP